MVLETVGALIDGGHSVSVVTPSVGPLLDEVVARGGTVSVAPVSVLRKALLSLRGIATLAVRVPGDLRRAIEVVRQTAPDLILVNTLTQPVWMLAARLCRVPLVVHVREAESANRTVVQRGLHAALRWADAVVVNSNATGEVVRRYRPRRSPDPTTVYNGKDWSPYVTAPLRSVRESPHLLFVGRLNARKGPDVAINAVRVLRDRGTHATLRIAGDVFPGYEWYERELVELVETQKLADRVSFLGFLPDIVPELHDTDILLVPSRLEPFGTIAAEGMAAGRPVIVSDVQGLREIVTDGETGIVVPPESPEAIADAVERLIRDPGEAHRLAQNGHEHVVSAFSAERYRQRILDICERWGR